MTLHDRAVEIVSNMTSLGAVFEIEPTPTGPTFVWHAKPPSQRDAVAAFWAGVDKLPGLRAAMLDAIRRRQGGGAL